MIKLIDSGLNVARFNFSHGDHESHYKALSRLRAACKARPNRHVAVMLDTKGPEIRTGFLESGDKVTYQRGQKLVLTTDYSFKGNEKRLACSYKSLPKSVKPGDRVLAADGSLVMKVLSCHPDKGEVVVECMNTATIGERKNMNLPGVIVDLPTVTEKDTKDLLDWGIPNRIDMIAASFVRKGQDVTNIRKILGKAGRAIRIISKIENQEGLENFDEILKVSDGIMVARGDLGMELPPEKVFLAQKMMIRKCNVMGKPVITATQMLESMISNPRPTRAECTDVANAVLDGTDCVMLSGETAGGQYPVEAVKLMASVCVEAESSIRYDRLFQETLYDVRELGTLSIKEAIASSAVRVVLVDVRIPIFLTHTLTHITTTQVLTASDVNAKMIVVLTETGNTARLVAKFRPRQPILVLTASNRAARISEGLYRGCKILHLTSLIGSGGVLEKAQEYALRNKLVEVDDIVVAIHGTVEGHSGHTNMMKVMRIAEKKTFKRGGEKRARSESGGVIRCTSGVDLSSRSPERR